MGALQDLREEVWMANMELFRKNLAVHTFGNVSGFDRDKGILAIKPSGIPYKDLTADKIVLVDLDLNVVDSAYKPSSDTRTHVVLYKEFPEIAGVAHTHSTYATSWAQSGSAVPCFGTTHADYSRGEIPCTQWLEEEQINGDYETETGLQIVKTLKQLPDSISMMLVAGHGPFTWGASAQKAVEHTILLEEICRMATLTKMINPSVESLSPVLIDKHFLRKHGKNSYYGQ